MKVFIAELEGYDGAADDTLYFTDGPGWTTGPSESPANAWIAPALRQPVQMRRDLFGGGTTIGQSRVGFGEMTLVNADGSWDHLRTWAFDGRTLNIYWAEQGSLVTAWDLVLTITVESHRVTRDAVVFAVRSTDEALKLPLQTNLYTGGNVLPAGLEGVADLEGKPKPLTFGQARNVPAVAVNSARLIYQVHDGEVADISAVYDRGILLSGGIEWESVTHSLSASGGEVAFGDGTFVRVANTHEIAYSTDNGATWTTVSTGASGVGLFGLVWSEAAGLWVFGGSSGTIRTTPDLSTFTSRTSGFGSSSIFGFTDAPGLGLIVAVGAAGKISTSPDGVTWTARTSGTANDLTAVEWNGQRLVACGSSSTVIYSADGITWSAADVTGLGSGFNFNDIRWGRDHFVLIGGSTTDGASIAVSPNGLSWANRYGDFIGAFWAAFMKVAYGQGRFVLVGNTGGLSSTIDGAILQNYVSPLGTEALAGVAFGGMDGGPTTFVAAGGNGDDVIIAAEPGTYASEADLLDDTMKPAPGTYKAYLAGGYFRLGAPPAGQVTADVLEGANAAARSAAQVWVRVQEKAGYSSGEWEGADVSALDTLNSAPIGIWVPPQEMSAAAVLTMAAQSVGAWWGPDNLGVFRIARFDDPSGETPAYTFERSDAPGWLDRIPIQDAGRGVPIYRSVIRYSKNYRVQRDDLAFGVADATKADLAQEWREVFAEDSDTPTIHLLSNERIDDTYIVNVSDAQDEADRRLTLWGEMRERYELSVTWEDFRDVELGDIVEVVTNRFGLDNGGTFVVLSLEAKARERQLLVGVWR